MFYYMKIKIIKAGPYVVSGNVPLREQIITPEGKGYRLAEGRQLPQAETYALCRCGQSKNAPFCDGSHSCTGFVGEETASREKFSERAKLLQGHSVDLLDDGRCAFVRFCYTDKGDAWSLVESSDTEENRSLAVKASGECLAGRLVTVSKSGCELEPELPPEISILQDPEKGVSAGIFVSGGIPIESDDGHTYEIRNRITLCRCGSSQNKPFCDGVHAKGDGFIDR
jgi:CDGSH-type Zn-finger protein